MFSGGKVKKYNTSISLKIDNEKPKINQISINKETKKIVVEANDGLGSGISGYYKTILGGNCASNSIVYNSSNELDVEENGSYLICVKDEVGNIEFENIVVDDL